jgi:hypothetical protein
MSSRVAVAGVGMIPFTTPRNTEPYHVMAEAAARKALDDGLVRKAPATATATRCDSWPTSGWWSRSGALPCWRAPSTKP